MRILWAFFLRDLKLAASYRLQLFVQLTGVLTLSFTLFFLGLMLDGVEQRIPSLQRYGGGYFGFALVGIAFSSYLDAALRSFAQALRQAQLTGTLEAMLSTGAGLGWIVAGSGLYTLFFTTLRVVGFLVVAVVVFRLPLDHARWGVALLVLGLTLSVTLVLGIVAASFVVRFQQGDPITAGIAGLSWLLSGVLYPKEILPPEVEALAALLPMTHSLEAIRLALLRGASLAELAGSLTQLGLFAVVGLPFAVAMFRWAVRSAKRSGSLGQY